MSPNPSPNNFSAVSMSALTPIHKAFEQIAQQFPEHIAIRSNKIQIEYSELNSKANQLAHSLIQRGISANTPIAFILDHDIPAIIAMLGILKAGGAYVPVEPGNPQARISHILRDLETNILITNNKNLPTIRSFLDEISGLIVINLDHLDASSSVSNPDLLADLNHYAYILYTSGSTGLPKGVIHSHLDVMHNMLAQSKEFSLSSKDRLALYISFGFEASRFAIYGALLFGGCLCLYDIRTFGVQELSDWIISEEISIILSTPSTFRYMLKLANKNRKYSQVRAINLGGEVVHKSDVDFYRQHFPRNAILVNTLGMTETGIVVRYIVDHRTKIKGNYLPSGYPIGEKKIILVDENRQPVKTGEVGEILVGSRFLAPGYWKQDQLNTEKFAIDPDDPSMRIFFTGDLGRIHPDGYLEYYGRKDSQIKIRGFRVDLSEIEAVLHQHPAIRNTAVTAHENPEVAGEKRLVAYIEMENNTSVTKKEIRSFLSQRLPDYMVPGAFIFLKNLPLTNTGKVNRQALPAPEPFTSSKENEFIAPRNPIEADLLNIWEQTLRMHPISVGDDFFELGGNSLLAAQLFASIEQKYKKKLPLSTLFTAPTIQEQANLIIMEDWIPNWSSLVALRGSGSRTPLFLAAPVGGNVLSYHDIVQHIDQDQPVFGLQAIGLDGVQSPQKNVKEIAAHYVSEILTILPNGPFLLGGSSFGGLVAYEMAQLLHDQGLSVDLVVMFDAYGPNYPRRLPGTTRLRRKVFKYLRRIDTHWSNLAATNTKGRFVYLQVKSKKLANRLGKKISNKLHLITHPLPEELRNIQNVHMGAAKKKKKRHQRENRRFGGRLVLFRADKQPLGIYPDPFLGWNTVAGDQIEVYEVPGHHTSIIYEPRVHILAKQLNRILWEIYNPEE